MELSYISRRQFLQRSGACAAGAGMALAVPAACAQTAAKPISPNSRIALGFIGMGAMGRWHFDRLLNTSEAVPVAVADPDGLRRAAAQTAAARQKISVSAYANYREMIARHPELDAVFIAAPDHWHAVAAIDAMRAGLDVHGELPLALTMEESRKMLDAAARYQRILQVETYPDDAGAPVRAACRWICDGRIGEVRRAVCFFGPNPCADAALEEEPPGHLDWDLYLGPAPLRPYSRRIHPFNFRYVRDFSGGAITEWGAELFSIAQRGLDREQTGPQRIEASIEKASDNFFDMPRRAQVWFGYGGVSIEWRQGLGEAPEPGQSYGVKFYGTQGEIFVNRSVCRGRRNNGEWLESPEGAAPASPGRHQQFFARIRTREQDHDGLNAAYRATALAHLGNIAMELNRPVEYDPIRECFVNDPEAARKQSRPMRAPWIV